MPYLPKNIQQTSQQLLLKNEEKLEYKYIPRVFTP